jgi:predicted enzyme related to lactoylglutathione lyase
MFQRLQPILHVQNVASEKAFYLALGFEVQYEAADFVAFSYGDVILFGLQQDSLGDAPTFGAQMEWQFGVTSVQSVADRCGEAGLLVVEPPHEKPWGEWMVIVQSPNGYRVVFEGPLTEPQ